MKISKLGLDLIKHFEGLHDGDLSEIGLQPKQDPVGIWTVGYGRALKDLSGNWLMGETDKQLAYDMYPSLTENDALLMLDEDCNIYENRVNSLGLELLQYQFDSLVSFAYNVGFANLKTSTLLKYIKAKETDENIMWEFGLWNKARVKGVLRPLPGLTKRRKAEAELFLTGKLIF
jgi:lysozyme